MELKKIIVTAIEVIAEQVFLLHFKRDFYFVAGQIIGLTNDEDLQPRLYSICSGPTDADVAILFNVKNDGELPPPLALVKPGDALWITPPQGKFISHNEPAWWIATGTGIAPFYSMYRNGFKPLKLIQGGRRPDDFYFQEEFSELDDYVRCSSQEQLSGLYSGRLTHYLKEQDALPTNINYYLCGSAEMVVDVRNLLIACHVPFDRIITEIYF